MKGKKLEPRIIHVQLYKKNHYDVRPCLASFAQPATLPLSVCTCSQAFFLTGTRGSVSAPFHVDELPLDMAESFGRFNSLPPVDLAARLAEVGIEQSTTAEALAELEKRVLAYTNVRVCSIVHCMPVSYQMCTHFNFNLNLDPF